MNDTKHEKSFINGFISIYCSFWNIFVIPLIIMAVLCILGRDSYSIALGIRPLQEGESVDFFAFGRWGAMMVLPIILDGFYLNNLKKINVFVRIRLNRGREYRMLQLSGCIINAALWSSIIVLIAKIAIKETIFPTAPVILTNQLLWGIFYAFMNGIAKLSPEISGGVVMIGFSVFHFLNEYGIVPLLASPTAWGMVYRSTKYIQTGITIQEMIMGNILIGVLFAVILITRPVDLEE